MRKRSYAAKNEEGGCIAKKMGCYEKIMGGRTAKKWGATKK